MAKRRKPVREMEECGQKKLALAFEKLKARIRARVEHPFHVVKSIYALLSLVGCLRTTYTMMVRGTHSTTA
jgi:hypothetical protein